MIDISKQYTYNGKPVRIYADGSDTVNSEIHCAIQNTLGLWIIECLYESDLVEVWEPKKGELVWAWCGGYTSPDTCIFGHNTYPNYAPFNNGKLPEAFKGLIDD